jgi:hypothetical protein
MFSIARVTSLLVLPLVFLVACGPPRGEEAPVPDEPAADAAERVDEVQPDLLPQSVAEQVEALGDPASRALAQGLVSRLSAAIESVGVPGAVDFCANQALVLTEQVQEAHNPDFAFKRTTLQWRNPANTPDAYEARILRYLEALEIEAPGSAPETLTAQGPDGTFRFYRVLRTAPMCLQCHGSEEGMDPEVRRIIAERYPYDRATGYEEGDLRGVIRIQMPNISDL